MALVPKNASFENIYFWKVHEHRQRSSVVILDRTEGSEDVCQVLEMFEKWPNEEHVSSSIPRKVEVAPAVTIPTRGIFLRALALPKPSRCSDAENHETCLRWPNEAIEAAHFCHFEVSPDLDLTPELTPELAIREVPTTLKMIPFRNSRSVNNSENDPFSSSEKCQQSWKWSPFVLFGDAVLG